MFDRCRRRNQPAATCRRVQIEAVEGLPGFQTTAERQLEVRLDLPSVLNPQRAGTGFALTIGVKLAGAHGWRVVPDRRCVGRILQVIAVAVEAETDFLRTVVPIRPPDALGIRVLPVR